MGRKLHLPESFEQQDFLKMMRKMRHGRNRIRLLAMHHIPTGKSLTAVSKVVNVHWSTIQGWIKSRSFALSKIAYRLIAI